MYIYLNGTMLNVHVVKPIRVYRCVYSVRALISDHNRMFDAIVEAISLFYSTHNFSKKKTK